MMDILLKFKAKIPADETVGLLLSEVTEYLTKWYGVFWILW